MSVRNDKKERDNDGIISARLSTIRFFQAFKLGYEKRSGEADCDPQSHFVTMDFKRFREILCRLHYLPSGNLLFLLPLLALKNL